MEPITVEARYIGHERIDVDGEPYVRGFVEFFADEVSLGVRTFDIPMSEPVLDA